MSADIAAFFRQYAMRYMAGEAEAVSEMCEAPFLAVRGGEPIHLADSAALRSHLAGLMEAYRNAGAAAADIIDLDVLRQGDGAALVTVHWNVRSATGDLIRDFRTSYQLAGPDPWRILSYVNHDARIPTTGKG